MREPRFKLWGLLIAIAILVFPLTACTTNPLFCQVVAGRKVCLLKLDRSAKNYWEYRALVAVDGVEQPKFRYDCRQRRQTPAGIVPFEAMGQWVCDRNYR